MMDEIVYREASVDDLNEILRIERSAREAPHWSEAAWRACFQSGPRERVVMAAEVDRRLCGYVALSSLAGVMDVENIAVSVEMRRRGVARGLLAAGLKWARQTHAERVELEVRQSSVAALGLYRSLGFQEQGRRVGYYSDPVEDAVLMSMSLR